MNLEIISPKKALNKAYLKEKVSRNEIQNFKRNLKILLDKINEKESEEHLKNVVADFLKNTWYKDSNEINTKGKSDLVIHNGKTAKNSVGVLLEVKRPVNRSEMMNNSRFNVKAFHELILYYLRERFEDGNSQLKHLIVTNIYEWYVIDENWFEKNIYRNSKLKSDFDSWKVSGKDTRAFYEDIAKTHLDEIANHIQCVYFDLRDFRDVVESDNTQEDVKLIALYKLLSPTNLLKLPFANDSNTLDRKFYTELLHIIGLEEKRDGGRKLIKRKEKPSHASILENAIIQLEDRDCLSNLSNLKEYGDNKTDQLYNVGLELTITWVNRILFLKLLEAQLYKYHKNNNDYRFLDVQFIGDYDDLNTLFFQVLAERFSLRRQHLQEKYAKVPYLNSSLFERTELERKTIDIGALTNATFLEILPSTVLKHHKGDKKTGAILTLQYLFEFLEAYDFTSEGSEEIQEQNKNLINASVLGLIFEKINGYKDGSFFTPGKVTMFICRETIRKAVIHKFNEVYSLNCETFDDLKNFIASRYKTKDILEFNQVINRLKICDPAVGSGHFLVSALNEILTVKGDLGILADSSGVRLTGYEVRVENDELIVTYNDNTEIFEYNVTGNSANAAVQRVQKTLFHEKETIIENCLFGVDINPNSVKICRLRLWIELLKNTYYKEESGFRELETLPNIDINIKCGNSLINRFPLDVEMNSDVKGKNSLSEYRQAFHQYHRAESKDEKRELERSIEKIKGDYTSEIYSRDPLIKRLAGLRGRRANIENKVAVGDLFEKSKQSEVKSDLEKLTASIDKIETTIDDIRKNKVYNHAFEWRFEFPDVLKDDGSFTGFDVIIGNPPYVFGGNEGISRMDKDFYKEKYTTGGGKINLFTLFIERGFDILKPGGEFSYIIPNTFLRVTSYHESRKHLIDNFQVNSILDLGESVFEDAITTAIVLVAEKNQAATAHEINISRNESSSVISQQEIKDVNYVIATNINNEKRQVFNTIEANAIRLGDICKEMIFGVVITQNRDEVVSDSPIPGWKPFLEGRDIGPYYINPVHSFLNYEPSLLHRARTRAIFEVPEKILIQRITGGSRPLKAAYDNQQYYNKESINNIILADDVPYACKYILGLLNSKLINWYYTNQFTNESRLTVNLSKEYLSQIPIAVAGMEVQQALIIVVDYLLVIHQMSEKPINEYVPNTYLATMFADVLDAMVFELYFKVEFRANGLTFIDEVRRNFKSIANLHDLAQQRIIHDAYQQLRQKENIIRNNLKLMDIRLPELVMPIKSIK
jgi:adenine-specific DNA-methyltransferase